MSQDQTEEQAVSNFRDLLVILNNGTRLITRMIEDVTDEEDKPIEDSYFMYEPHELIRLNDGRLIMVKWIAETTDKVIPIPIEEVLTAVHPDDDLLKYYLQQIGVIPKPVEMPSHSVH